MHRHRSNKRRLSFQVLESRRVLAASFGWDGPGLGSAMLTYNIANSPSSLSQSETNAAIETALAAWSAAANITFVPTSQIGLRDSIDISFTRIDGPGGTLAQAYFPDDVNPARIAGDIQFDLLEVWEVGNSLGNRAFDLVWVAVHEIGHSLGLDHTGVVGSVLAPFVSPATQFVSLVASDVAAIEGLYAKSSFVTTSDSPSSETPSTVTPGENPVNTDSVNNEPANNEPTSHDSTDTADTDDDPFPRWRWRRGGRWQRWGGRLDADVPANHNLYNPTDVNGDGNTTAGDALTIINQLNRSASTDDDSVTGMCDTNGDGLITASDALTVINRLNSANSVAETTLVIAGVHENASDEQMEDGIRDEGMSDGETTNEGTTNEEPTNNETTNVDDMHEDEEMIDDGGMIDDDEIDDDHPSDHGPDHGHCGRRGFGGRFLFGDNAALILTRFDTSGDGLLQADEVSERFWLRISAADTNADDGVSLEELDILIAARQADGNETKEVYHGHQRLDRVFGQLGRGRIRGFERFR